MWLVKEGGFDTNSEVWWRPATHFSKELESQFQANIGYQHGEMSYVDQNSGPKTYYYAHDLRGEDHWVQRRYWDEERTKLRNEKQIIRVSVG